MQQRMRIRGVLLLASMLVAGVVWATAPEAPDVEAAFGMAIETQVESEVQPIEPVVELGSCGESGLDLGLPQAALTSDVISFCPVDGTFCYDPDLCRIQCRTCGVELAACFLGLCHCIDT